jgi:carbamoyltransferase
MYVYRDKTKDCNIKPIKNTFFNNINYKIDIKGKTVDTDDIAEYLTQGKVVAVYNGMAESGPRSLGNRSILFDPRVSDAKNVINKIKKREWYRPFACSILEEYFEDYFFTLGLKKSEFMTMSFDVKNNKIPGVTHINNSCRVQTVNENILHFYDLLKSFYLKTNIPVLLNTSFNLAGEPLVDSPEDDINTYERSNIDILWFPEKKIMLSKY